MIAVTIRTADRSPKPNYVGATVRQLLAQGVAPDHLYVAATDPEVGWLRRELASLQCYIDVPQVKRGPNENGLAQIACVPMPTRYDWILLLEDDLQFCADFLGSVERWLAKHARKQRHLYRFFGFAVPPGRVAAYDCRLERLRGSQAQALRVADALDFLAWGRAHLHDWHQQTPWGRVLTDPWRGFDKFLATWALSRWPHEPGLISHPHFVRHVGMQSGLHGRTVANDREFAGTHWSYQG